MSLLRSSIAAGVGVILLGVNGYLLTKEDIAPPEQKARHLAVKQDPLGNMTYAKAQREGNFKEFGFEGELLDKVMDRIRDLEDRKKDRLAYFLDQADEPTEIADAVCGQNNQIRPRYGALRFLVTEEKGRRDTIDVDRASGLEMQDWARVAPIEAVYDHAELSDDRHPDATLMAIAAILSQKEQDLLNDYAPWGRGLAQTWAWKGVKKEHPGIEARVVDYFATMHLTVELATGDDGICSQ